MSLSIGATAASSSHWFDTIGSSSDESGHFITSSGGFLYVAGTTDMTDSNGGVDFFLAKIDSDGGLRNYRVIGEGSSRDVVTGITHDDDGNIYFVGYTDAFTPSGAYGPVNAIFVAKFDSNANLLWAEYVGASSTSDDDYGEGIVYGRDGYLYITGSYQGELFVAKINPSDGKFIWFKTYGVKAPTEESIPITYSNTEQSLYIAYETAGNYGQNDVYVIKLDVSTTGDGDPLWYITFGGAGYDYAKGIITGKGGSVVVAGYTSSFRISSGSTDEDYNAYVVIIDPKDGSVDYRKLIGEDGTDDEAVGMVYSAQDENIYITGFTKSYGAGGYDGFVAGLDYSLNIKWFKTIGGSSTDIMMDIAIGPGNYLYTTGYTDSFGAGGNDLAVLLASDSLSSLTSSDSTQAAVVKVNDVTPGSTSFTPSQTALKNPTPKELQITAKSWDPNHDTDYAGSTALTVTKYTDNNTPDPVPEPWLVSMTVLGILTVSIFLISRRN